MDHRASTNQERRTYLSTPREDEAFARSFLELARLGLAVSRERYIPSQNVHRFFHGSRHVVINEGQAEDVKIQSHIVEMKTSFEEIASGNLQIIADSLNVINAGLHSQFARSLYSMLSETCDKTGNSVSHSDQRSTPAALEAMLEKIEFFSDKHENVRLPELHLPTSTACKIIEQLETQPKDYHDRIEDIKKRKIEEAIQRERARKARFVFYGAP